jgi:flagellar motility protein MotE (MotC chaperone)
MLFFIKKSYKFSSIPYFMVNWQENIKSPLKLHLDKVIKNSAEYKDTIALAKDKKTAQLWISLAQLSKDLRESKVRIKYLEALLVELLEEKKKHLRTKKKKQEVDKLIKTLKKF